MQQGRDRSRPCSAVQIVRFRPRLNVFTSNLGTASSQFRPDWPDPRVRLVRKNHFRAIIKANDVPKPEQFGFGVQSLQTFAQATRAATRLSSKNQLTFYASPLHLSRVFAPAPGSAAGNNCLSAKPSQPVGSTRNSPVQGPARSSYHPRFCCQTWQGLTIVRLVWRVLICRRIPAIPCLLISSIIPIIHPMNHLEFQARAFPAF